MTPEDVRAWIKAKIETREKAILETMKVAGPASGGELPWWVGGTRSADADAHAARRQFNQRHGIPESRPQARPA